MGPADQGFEVWPENWPALQAFNAVQTQWSTGFGGPTGLDYQRVRAGFELAGITPTRELFDQLRLIEAAALDVFGKSQKTNKESKK
jgi:hypothetical protein